jgi:hypothetical protein
MTSAVFFQQTSRDQPVSDEFRPEGLTGFLAEARDFLCLPVLPTEVLDLEERKEVLVRRLWEHGARDFLRVSLAEYRLSLPELPFPRASLLADFPLLLLIDRRLPLPVCASHLSVELPDKKVLSEDLKAWAPSREVYWMFVQDGRRYQGQSVQACRRACQRGGEVPFTLHEGLMLLAQYPAIRGRGVDTPASVLAMGPGYAMNLNWCHSQPEIDWRWDEYGDPSFGSATGIRL